MNEEVLLRDRIAGYIIGDALASWKVRSLDDVWREIDHSAGLYSVLLRLIVFQNPDPLDLLDWMIMQENSSFAEAARCIIENDLPSDREVDPIRALLLIMLHPDLSLQKLIFNMKKEDRSESSIEESATLVGSYLGEYEIRDRAKK